MCARAVCAWNRSEDALPSTPAPQTSGVALRDAYNMPFLLEKSKSQHVPVLLQHSKIKVFQNTLKLM